MRAIDADALKNAFEEDGHMSGYIEEFIDDMPTLDVVTVVHGRWIDNGIQGSMLSGCSVCGFTCGAYTFNYCPNCGAIMDLED